SLLLLAADGRGEPAILRAAERSAGRRDAPEDPGPSRPGRPRRRRDQDIRDLLVGDAPAARLRASPAARSAGPAARRADAQSRSGGRAIDPEVRLGRTAGTRRQDDPPRDAQPLRGLA